MLDELHTLSIVASTGSLLAAAERRGLTQSAVTRQMQRLEELLGLTLFDRRVKPLKLTRAGREVLVRGSAILSSVETLKQSVRHHGAPSGSMRIGLAHGLSEPGFSQPIQRLKVRLPNVLPSLVSDLSSNHLRALQSGDLDVAIVLWDPAVPVPSAFDCRKVGREEMMIVGLEDKFARHFRIGPETQWIVNPQGCLFRTKLDHWLQGRFGTPIRIAAEAHDTALQSALIASGLGLGLVPKRIFEADHLSARLRKFDVPGLRLAADILVLRAYGLGALAKAVDVIEEELGRSYSG